MSERTARYEAKLKSMPPGLDRAVLRVVSGYQAAAPISRGELVINVTRLGFRASERQVRETIKQLRRQGHLIGSKPGNNGGYYLVRTREEFEEFMKFEFEAKIYDMLDTKSALIKSARDQFGDGFQLGLGL